jgi:tRNA threonylcarbamoyladenosine biosynthesis protein TsaB
MARVLAIDVSGPGGGAALAAPGLELLETLAPDVPRARDLVPAVERLLGRAGIEAGELDCVACGVGPGSFTGIRIGVATAASLAYAAGVAVLDVGSLDGIAAGAPDGAGHVCVALDARRGHVFACLFHRTAEGLVAAGPYLHVEPDQLAGTLPPGTHVLGDARRSYAVLDRFPGRPDAPVRPDAIARIAARRFERGERKRPDELRPLYLRLSDPEIRRGARG